MLHDELSKRVMESMKLPQGCADPTAARYVPATGDRGRRKIHGYPWRSRPEEGWIAVTNS